MSEIDRSNLYLDEDADYSDLESDQVWDEYDDFDAERDGFPDETAFAESYDEADGYDPEFALSDVNEDGFYDAENAPRRVPWQGFMSGVTFSVCLLLGWLLYLFTSSAVFTGFEEVDKSLAAPLETSAASMSVELSAESDQIQNLSGECGVNPNFPQAVRQWCELITEQAEKRGLPPDLVAALILQESGGNPEAYSRSGAVGLMQVMPRDGLAASFMCVNGPCFSNRPSTSELQDPAFNLSYGTKMLAGLLNTHGNFREALRSYGPMDAGYTYADKVLGIYQRYGN
ncbi:MAG: transglycosylase SLT domain-containing protein [Anaerolineae bacterium]|nr:transglycosylase SLT domain-containing protein [Anaerolineae bacterium]